ncbi:MAG: hypothetical protein RIR95_1101 [Pseudomonadota bacterium]
MGLGAQGLLLLVAAWRSAPPDVWGLTPALSCHKRMYRFRGFHWDKASLPSKASRDPDYAAPTARMAFAQLGGRFNPCASKQRVA